ncbi:hypothetical protein [Fontibacillus panacisegetis]|uniref:hypothetical protein n=1 Tax=Fontibacillus panacisegetis TaxID=670482 RepID=UPI0011142089|nr:hypothetical protein [Fontibacillus panacisegetis]
MEKIITKLIIADVDIFYKDQDIVVRFYDGSREPKEEEIVNLVVVDPGFGYLYLKFKGDAALLSGYLNEIIFSSDEMVDAAIQYIEDLAPQSKNLYMPYHISRVRETSCVEYNGEY